MAATDSHLYCARCSLTAVMKHAEEARARGQQVQPPHFQVTTTGEVENIAPNVWAVPRAHVVMGGESLCAWHMIEAVFSGSSAPQ